MSDGLDFELGSKPLKLVSIKVGKKPKKQKRTPEEMNKDKLKKAVQEHKQEIAKIKAQRARLKQDIKAHKLLIKQAKNTYKLNRIREK